MEKSPMQANTSLSLESTERRSKWIDGVLASALFLLLVVALIVLTIGAKRLGAVALGVETAVTLALAIFLLHRSLQPRFDAVARAWYGIVGGFLAWTTTEASALLGLTSLDHEGNVVLFLLAALALPVMARHGLPLGARFWLAAFVLNWGGHIVLFVQRYLAQDYPIFAVTYRVSGVLAGLAIVGIYAWIFRRSQTRLQRLQAALWVFVMIIIVVYAIRGFW
jgi:hypothetical protein